MTSLALTAKGQITLKRDLLQHLGVEPGQRLELAKLPAGELRIRAVKPSGSINDFIGRFAGRVKKPISIEEMNEIIASSWAGER